MTPSPRALLDGLMLLLVAPSISSATALEGCHLPTVERYVPPVVTQGPKLGDPTVPPEGIQIDEHGKVLADRLGAIESTHGVAFSTAVSRWSFTPACSFEEDIPAQLVVGFPLFFSTRTEEPADFTAPIAEWSLSAKQMRSFRFARFGHQAQVVRAVVKIDAAGHITDIIGGGHYEKPLRALFQNLASESEERAAFTPAYFKGQPVPAKLRLFWYLEAETEGFLRPGMSDLTQDSPPRLPTPAELGLNESTVAAIALFLDQDQSLSGAYALDPLPARAIVALFNHFRIAPPPVDANAHRFLPTEVVLHFNVENQDTEILEVKTPPFAFPKAISQPTPKVPWLSADSASAPRAKRQRFPRIPGSAGPTPPQGS